ncbi:MAG: zf-HC2 domain-containing protein [Candidatus Brocadiae bacterium]|nr:zf-HC2 domain-containing protein [Candidatus Brocadiia bacterium]
MSCHEIRPLLGEQIDGLLGAAEAAAVHRHLGVCAACRAEMEALQKAIDAVAALPRRSAPGGFEGGVSAEIRMRGQIAAYADGSLTPEDADEVERHMAACAGCREELQDLRRLAETLRTMPGVAAPRGFAASVLTAIRAEKTARAPQGTVLQMPRAILVLRAFAAAAAVLGIWLGVSWWPDRGVAPNSETGTAGTGTFKQPFVGLVNDGDKAGQPDPIDEAAGRPTDPVMKSGMTPEGNTAPTPADLTPHRGRMPADEQDAGIPDLAVRRITVYSTDIAVDVQEVKTLLSDAGYTWTSQGENRKVLARVPASRANELLAKLSSSSVAGFRAESLRDVKDLARTPAPDVDKSNEWGDRKKKDGPVEKALASELEEHLKDSRRQIEKAKETKREEKQQKGAAAKGDVNEVPRRDGMHAGGSRPPAAGAAAGADLGDDHREPQGSGSGGGLAAGKEGMERGGAPGGSKTVPPSAPVTAGEAGRDRTREGNKNFEEDGDSGLRAERESAEVRKLREERQVDELLQEELELLARQPLSDEEEAVVLVIEFTETLPAPAEPGTPAPGK